MIYGQKVFNKSLMDVYPNTVFVHLYEEKASLGQRERGEDLQIKVVCLIRLARVGGKKSSQAHGHSSHSSGFGEKDDSLYL